MSTTALTAPVLAASFSVGGGTITTTQADASSDLTGTGGPFALQANTISSGDAITVTGVSITNSSHTPNGRALDIGGLLSSSGDYSVTMHGSTLAGDGGFSTGGAGAWFQSVGGLLSFDSTGSTTNTISGKQGLAVINNTNNGSVSIKTGADIITSTSGEALYGVAQGTGTISIDIAGATLNSSSLYGIAAVGGNGLITLGGLNGGLSGTINAASGSGIYTTSTGNQSITLASSGTINAVDGMSLQGVAVTVDSFGTINATNNAIAALNGTTTALAVTLESGSITKGKILGAAGNDVFNILPGADITNAIFDGGTGANTLMLNGGGSAIFSQSSASNIGSFEVYGDWTVTGSPLSNGGWTVFPGATLRAGGNINVTSITFSGGVFDVGGQTVTVGTLLTTPTKGLITLGSGNLTVNGAANSGAGVVISGSGSLTKSGSGTLLLAAANTYTGGTIVNGGVLQLVFGSGSLASNGAVTVNSGTFDLAGSTQTIGALSGTGGTITLGSGILTTSSSANTTLASVISGYGSLIKTGSGTLTLTGANTYLDGTAVNGGVLQLGSGGSLASSGALTLNGGIFDLNGQTQTIGALSGTGGAIVLGSGSLTTNSSTNTSVFSAISGSGSLTKAGTGTLTLVANNAYTGVTTIAGGMLQLGNGGATGIISGDVVDNGALVFNRNNSFSFAGIISGTGGVSQAGSGTVALIANNSYSGGTAISSGTLVVGNGATSGSISGNVTNNGTLMFNRSDNITFGGAISGTGSVVKTAAGALTLTGNSTYVGTTTVSAGTLNVTGSSANSRVTVASGAVLNGTGTVGATIIQTGGTLAPGNSIGTLTVNGNLTLASGAIYNVEVSPIAAGRTTVSGTASLDGNVIASVTSGIYAFGQRYTLINAASGVSGTFASLTGIPVSLKGQLSYDANNAYLTLSPSALAPLLTNPTGNQQNVVSAIDAAVAAGNVPPAGFVPLYSLSGPALNSALDQISGQIGPNVTSAAGQSFLSFLSMTAAGGSGATGDFAPGSAYGGADAPHRAQLGATEIRVWGAAYGGHVGLSADAASGAASLSASNVGFIGGADIGVDDGLLAGVTVGFGRQNFSSGNGTGDSDDIMIGLYARKEAGPLYVTAAFGYGWHQITTQRVVTISGTDILQGKQDADDFGGRVEAGWRMALDDQYTLSPYAAIAAESFEAPAYAETAISGASTFALSIAAHSSTLGRSELGAALARDYQTGDGVLAADMRLAWAHQLDDLPFTQASFQGLPGASFVVSGVRSASDTALLGVGLELRQASGLFVGVKGESQLGAGTTILEGMGTLGWRW